MKFILSVLFLISFFSINSKAQMEQKPKVDSSKPIKLNYNVPSWNKNKKAVDISAILFRDFNTGKLVRIELQETGPNTNEFVGTYVIRWEEKEIVPEIYFAPQEMMKDQKGMKQIDELIKDEVLARKPIFVRTEKNTQRVTVYDTFDQALSAYENFRKAPDGKPVVSEAALAAARAAQVAAEQRRLAELARQQELERIRIAEAERRKAEERKKQLEAMDAAEKARRKKEASELAAKAVKLYKEGKYPEAETLFDKSIEIDPFSTGYYFYYGAALYKNQKYNKAVVALGMAKEGDFDKNEKLYLLAASHMKLKELDTAYNEFSQLKGCDNKTLSASSAFFMGLLDFQKEKYDLAKTHFEFVLDNSEDKLLDEQAENYIEQIANIKMFEEQRKKKFLFTVNIGYQNDSNVTSASDATLASESAPTVASMRLSYGGSVEYRPVYGVNHEWSTIYNYANQASTNADVQAADALVTSLSFPYKYKGTLGKKGYQFGFTPSLETISLDTNADNVKEAATSSTVAKFDNMIVMNDDWFANYGFEWRRDTALIEASDPVDDSNATKITLNTTQTFFKDKKKTTADIYEAGIAQNTAVGANNTSTKLDLAYSYMMPWNWDTSANFRFAFYNQNFSTHAEGRKDNNLGITASIRKPMGDTLALAGSFNYTINNSSLEANTNKKYVLGVTLTWTPSW